MTRMNVTKRFIFPLVVLVLVAVCFFNWNQMPLVNRYTSLSNDDSSQLQLVTKTEVPQPPETINALREKIHARCRNDSKVPQFRSTHPHGLKNDKHKLFYFPIPKIGCSFWKRVFKVINSNQQGVHLFDIPNFKAHDGQDINSMIVRPPAQIKHYSTHYTSFVFVRDPFARLFSGYVDKMMVPNKVYKNPSRTIFQRYRSQEGSNTCGLHISFATFALYIADAINAKNIGDDHFYPMWTHCNPCEMNVTYVGKMESFMEDTKYILSTAGIDINQVAGAQNNDGINESNQKGIMKDLVDVTFDDVRPRQKTLCLSRKELLDRLWKVFQIRGHVSKHISPPEFDHPETVSVEQFVDVAWKAFHQFGPKSKRTLQREEAMMEAYSLVPRDTLLKLAKAFGTDCRLFDYSCDVEKRFLSQPKPLQKYFFNR